MKRGLESVGFILKDGTLLGLCLGHSSPRDHGRGIGGLMDAYGVDPGEYTWPHGQPGRWQEQPDSWVPIRKVPKYLRLGLDRRTRRLILSSCARWPASADLRRAVAHLVGTYDDGAPVVSGWDERWFSVAVTDAYAPHLRALYEALMRLDVAMGVSILTVPTAGPAVLNGLKLIICSGWRKLHAGDRNSVGVL